MNKKESLSASVTKRYAWLEYALIIILQLQTLITQNYLTGCVTNVAGNLHNTEPCTTYKGVVDSLIIMKMLNKIYFKVKVKHINIIMMGQQFQIQLAEMNYNYAQ